MKYNFKPLNNNVLVQLIEKNKSAGGILLPDTDNPHGIVTGIVEDMGESFYDAWGNPISINVNKKDTVYFMRRDAMELFPNTGKCLVAYKSLMGKAA